MTVSQKEKNKYIISLIYDTQKNNTDEHIAKQKQRHRHREQTYGYHGDRLGDWD